MKKFVQPIVLMYHGVPSAGCPAPPNREPGAELYDVGPDMFRRQMALIRERGGTVGPLGDGLAPPSVILTFDDGERNNRAAVPVLEEFGFRAYFFITAQRIGRPGYLDWPDLAALSDAGMIVGAHGLTHRILTTLDDDDLRREFTEPQRLLEERLGRPARDFSVPRGFYDQRVLAAAREAGYDFIFVSDRRSAGDAVIPRTAVKGSWTMERFAMALDGKVPAGERWRHSLLGAMKRILGGRLYDSLRTKWMGNG